MFTSKVIRRSYLIGIGLALVAEKICENRYQNRVGQNAGICSASVREDNDSAVCRFFISAFSPNGDERSESKGVKRMNKHVYVDLIRDAIDRFGERDCLHIRRGSGYRTWTYNDFHRDLNRLSDALGTKAFGRGENGIVIGENTPEWVIAFHGMILAGGRAVPVDPNLPTAEIADIVRATEASVVFCSQTYLSIMHEIKANLPSLTHIVTLDDSVEDGEVPFTAFLETGDPDRDAFEGEFRPNDEMVVIFTSGTTGKPKGAVLMQKNYTAAGTHGVPRMGVGPDDTMLGILPLHHVFGFAACIAATLTTGMDVVLVPQIKGPLILQALKDKHVSILPAVPKMLTVLYDNIERKVQVRGPVVRSVFGALKMASITAGPLFGQEFRRKLFKTVHEGFGGRVRLIVSGGASLPERYFEGFRRMGFNIVEGYGLTETFGPITLCPLEDARQGSVGPPLEENEAKIDNPDDEGIGEVLLRGITVFSGYYKNPEATEAVFDKDGWFHTGDLGRLTKDGFLYLSGRSKDVIVLESGKNVFPEDLEEYYNASEFIEEIGIFGGTVKNREVVAAMIVPSAEIRKKHSVEKANEIIHNEMIRLGRNRASYKKVTDFAVSWQPLPRTTTRKLRKHELRDMYLKLKKDPKSAIGGRLSAPEEALMEHVDFQKIAARVRETVQAPKGLRITPRTNLEIDLELDSLRKLDLHSALEEEFGLVIPEEVLIRVETVGDLFTEISELKERGESTEVNRHTLRERIAVGAEHHSEYREHRNPVYHAAPALVKSLSSLLWGVKVKGTENVPPDHPVIFASNHQSVLDIVWILGALPWETRKKTFTIGKVELLDNPLVGSVLKSCNLIPVERSGDVVEALKASIAVLKQKKNLVIFPEGTRTRDGQMGPFKSGVGLLMLESNAMVVPTKIRGSYAVWPKGKVPNLLAGRSIEHSVTFGKPITIQTLIDEGRVSPRCTGNCLADQVREAVVSL